jgi:hypothetical protein
MACHWRGALGILAAVFAIAVAAPASSQHGHGEVRARYGTAVGHYPDLDKGSPHARAQARRLWQRTRRAANRLFPTYRAARRLGFTRYSRKLKRPVVFHLRHDGYAHDGRWLDAKRPESLAYWWPAKGRPVLVAYMYRMRPGGWPRYAKPLLGWHSHERHGVLMTHVWLTRSLRSAIANCMPVPALEAAHRDYRFAPPRQGYSRESHPCREAKPEGAPG